MTSRFFAEVIGDPIQHSKSPVIHDFWLGRLGIDADYLRTRVSTAELPAFINDRLADPNWRGCNVTMPLKLDALLLADESSDAAVQAGASNLLVPRSGRLLAGNTDVGAVVEVLRRLAGNKLGRGVTLLGSGGAARAVLVALAWMGVRDVVLQGRNQAEAAKLATRFQLRRRPEPMDAPVRTPGLINATPLGMTGYPPLEISLEEMPTDGWLFDLVSTPSRTQLMQRAEERGLVASGGLAMLIEQAAESFAAFFGKNPPRSEADDRELMERLQS